MKKISCTNYEYTSQKIGNAFDGFKITVLSDLHAVDLGNNNEDLYNKIKEISPDIIITAGDMVSSNGKNFNTVISLFERLIEICPIYYGIGNHELKLSINDKTTKKFKYYKRQLRKMGVKILNNRSIRLRIGEKVLRISGVNIEKKYYSKFYNKSIMPSDYINSLLKPCNNNRIELLIAHNPDYFDNYVSWGSDIVLSGHIHGGLVVLPILGGVIAPSLRLFPYYDYGCFANKDSMLYLSRGLGAHTIPIRLFNPPEIMTVTLRNSYKNTIDWM